MKSLSKLLIFLFLFVATKRFCDGQTEGFQTLKVISTLPASQEWEIEGQDPEKLRALFSQPFSFLGSGGQCYAFLSQDGKVVLKLFKMHHLHPYAICYSLPLPGLLDRFRLHFLSGQRQKLQQVFSSSHLAYTALKEETGLLALNLNPQPGLENIFVTVVDKLGISHRLNLSHTPFALQYRASNPFKALRKHLFHNELKEAKQIVREIMTFLTTRYEKGITDADPALRRNIGLLKNHVIAIDIGSFSQHSLTAEEKQQELLKDTRRMHRWLSKRSPELTAYFDNLITNYVSRIEVAQEGEQANQTAR